MTDVIAHRGLHAHFRENTVDAFAAAVDAGVSGVELDVRRTVDEVLVVHHDAHLDHRDGGGAIVERQQSELPAWLPTLADALDACAGVGVNIEIKNDPNDPDYDEADRVAVAVLDHLARRSEPASTWLISSFRRATIERCRAIDDAVPTAWLTAASVTGHEVADVVAGGHAAIHPWYPTVDADTVIRCHAAGLAVNIWTCNDAARAAELASWGVDGICTDTPVEVLDALNG